MPQQVFLIQELHEKHLTLLEHPLAKLVDLLKLGQNPLVLGSVGQLSALVAGQQLAWLGASTDDQQCGKEKGNVDLVHVDCDKVKVTF